ncbi:MAG TPA: amidohydrolase family protein, partial [Vicingus sp.]|nr:amidohydrolase family protein [Vicingus sp.]
QYIEGRQPNYHLFLNEKCTIGTDSLASNWSLSILDELKTISNNSPNIELEKLIKWATINGAEFLGIDNQYGSIEKGKKPGINLARFY